MYSTVWYKICDWYKCKAKAKTYFYTIFSPQFSIYVQTTEKEMTTP